jgi:hypothetical protein
MSRLDSTLLRSAAVVAVVLFSCSIAGATEQQPGVEIAETTFSSSGIAWQPAVDYKSAELVVSGPGDLNLRLEFAADEALVFRVNGGNHSALEDGQYAWELRFSPVTDAAVKQALRSARESGDTSEIEALKKEGKLPSEPLVISGYFRVKGGWIVADETEAAPRHAELRGRPPGSSTGGVVDADPGGIVTKDQVIADDLIAQGSACVGFDCVNGESFGFDTLRLKENNLRIRFYDTSTSGSFPSNDWQITANDSSNGGANKFSIDDIDSGRTPFTIEAGARTNALYVESDGDVGIGTSNPVVELHIVRGDTPTLRLEQDGSSGFTPQTWDVAGNETNFFIRDATNGSRLPFKIRPSAPDNSIYINTNGNVGLRTTSPDQELDIEANGPNFRLTNSGSGGGIWDFRVNADTGRFTLTDDPANTRNPFKIGVGANNNLVKIGIGDPGEFKINGTLSVNGSVEVDGFTVHADYVFGPDYELESITDHATYMWERRHLPALPPAGEDGTGTVDLVAHQMGILEELEKAHIYIEQLHEQIKVLELRISEIEASSD